MYLPVHFVGFCRDFKDRIAFDVIKTAIRHMRETNQTELKHICKLYDFANS